MSASATCRPPRRLSRAAWARRSHVLAAGLASPDRETYQRSAGAVALCAWSAQGHKSPDYLLELLAAAVPHDRRGTAVRAILSVASARCPETVQAVATCLDSAAASEPTCTALIDFLATSRLSVAGAALGDLIERCGLTGTRLAPTLRAVAAYAVAALDPAPRLGRVAADPALPTPLRLAALQALEVVPCRRLVGQLAELLDRERHGGLLRAAGKAIAAVGTPACIDRLGDLAQRGPVERRVAAARALAGSQHPLALDWLRRLARSRLALVREEAYRALVTRPAAGLDDAELGRLTAREPSAWNRRILQTWQGRRPRPRTLAPVTRGA
jgi:HEAT repeat protein